MATQNPAPQVTEKTITCPAEKVAQIVTIMNQLGFAIKSTGTSSTAGAVELKADLTDDQVKALANMITKLERRETVASVLHKTGNLVAKVVDVGVNDVGANVVGVATIVGANVIGTGAKFVATTGAKLVNDIAEAGVKTVNDVRVSQDAQKLKMSLQTIGNGFGLFESNSSGSIKIA